MIRTERILAVALLAGLFATGFSGAADPREAIGGVTDSIARNEGPRSARVPTACPWTYCTATSGNKGPIPARAGRLEFPGFSILAPPGEGWSLMSPQEALHFRYDALFVKNISPAGSVHAYATAHRTATSFTNPAEILKASVEQFIKPGGRLLKTSTDRLSGASCIRWEKSQNAGTASLGDKSGHEQIALVSRDHGYLCSHPDAPAYVVEIGYFETVPKGTRGSLSPEEGGSFIKALAFTSLDVKVSQFSAGRESRGLALGYDALWVTEEGAGMVSRIDVKNGAVVARIPVGKRPEGFTIGLGAVWVPNWASDTVSRIDPKTNRVVATIPVGRGPSDAAVGQGSVWITNEKDWSVSRVDPGTNRVIAIVRTDGRPVVIAASPDALWVEKFRTDEIWRIDLKTNRVTATIRVGRGRHLIASDEDAVWVSNAGDDSISRINPVTNQVVATVRVGSGPMGLASAGGALWVANFGDSTISRIDPQTNEIKGRPIPIGESPFFLSGNSRAVWVLSEWGHWQYGTLSRINF